MGCLTGWGRSVFVVAAVLAGCGGNVTVPRGFGSREVMSLRDSTINFSYVSDVQGQDPVLVYSTQGADAAITYWSLDLMTGSLQNDGPIAPSATSSGPASSGRYSCQFIGDSNRTDTIEVTDTMTGLTTNVDGVSGYATCPDDDGFLAVFRLDPNDDQNLILWLGPYQQLSQIALPIQVRRIVTFTSTASDAAAPVYSGAIVTAAVPGQPDQLGIYRIDFPSAQVTGIVPATPASAAWAAGAQPAGSLDSTSVSMLIGISPFNGHYIYARTMSDGGTTLFAGPFDSGAASELALIQLSASGYPDLGQGLRVSGPDDSSTPVRLPAMASWELDDETGANPSRLIVWDDTDQRVATCPSVAGARQAGVLSPDGGHVLFSVADSSSLRSVGPLQLLTMGADGPHDCVPLADGRVFWADSSGDASMIAWIVESDDAFHGQLWISAADGSDAQMVFSGALYGARFVTGTSKLELSYGGDLVWLDVHDPTHLVYVAEQMFGYATGVSDSWFVGGYEYNTQDSSGTLGTINLDDGRKVPISPSVGDYIVAPQFVPRDTDALSAAPVRTGLYHVVYLVRGRNPSLQDGIWVATVQAADLQ
jgi:hypothetical protein